MVRTGRLSFIDGFGSNCAMRIQSLRFLLLAACFGFALPLSSLSQETATPAPTAAATPSGSHLDPAAATQAWLDTVQADKRAKSDAYFEGRVLAASSGISC